MPPLTVQLETMPRALGAFSALDLSDLQLAQALHRPVVAVPDASDSGLAKLRQVDIRNGNSEYELMFDCRLPHIPDAKSLLESACGSVNGLLENDKGMARLLGIRVLHQGKHRLMLSAAVPKEVLARHLSSLRWHRETQSELLSNSGKFAVIATSPNSIDLSRHDRKQDCEIRLLVEPRAAYARRAFESDQLNISSAGAFDLAKASARDRNFHPCETNIHSMLFINPRSVTVLRDPKLRLAFYRSLRCPVALSDLLAKEVWPLPNIEEVPKPYYGKNRSLELIYGDYFPNLAIAEVVAETLRDLNIAQVRLQKLNLSELALRISQGNFELALSLSIENQLPEIALRFRLASAAMQLSTSHEKKEDAFLHYRDALIDNPDPYLMADILSRLPIVPLFRFRSGVLCSPQLSPPPMINGTIVALEKLLKTEIIHA